MPDQKKTRKPIKQLSVNFSGVEDRKGGPKGAHVPEGDYVLEVVDAEVRKKKDSDSRYISWQLKIVKPKMVGKDATAGKTIYHITTLKQESLWSLRNFLADLLGKEIPKKALDIDLTKYKGKMIGATVNDDDPFEDKSGKERTKSKIDATFPAADYSEESEDAEEEDEDSDEEEAEDEVTSSDDDEDVEELDTDDL